MKIAVIAGTPVDTKMGVEYLEKKNAEIGSLHCEPIYMPVSDDCEAQLHFQYLDDASKRVRIDEIFDAGISEGARDFFIYCNSLAGAFDFDAYEREKSDETGHPLHIYTPLQVYKSIAGEYRCIGVMAAHNLSAHAIEEALTNENTELFVIGTGNMAVVRAIEDGKSAKEIVEAYGLGPLTGYMALSGAEAILLGCTHFPYLKDELQKVSPLPLIDPADMMYDSLSKR